MTGSLFTQLVSRGAERVDRAVGWSKLPTPLAVPVLIGLRQRLRDSNLYDVGRGRLDRPPNGSNGHRNHLHARTLDGTYNDLERSADGQPGQPLRSKRADRDDLPRGAEAAA